MTGILESVMAVIDTILEKHYKRQGSPDYRAR